MLHWPRLSSSPPGKLPVLNSPSPISHLPADKHQLEYYKDFFCQFVQILPQHSKVHPIDGRWKQDSTSINQSDCLQDNQVLCLHCTNFVYLSASIRLFSGVYLRKDYGSIRLSKATHTSFTPATSSTSSWVNLRWGVPRPMFNSQLLLDAWAAWPWGAGHPALPLGFARVIGGKHLCVLVTLEGFPRDTVSGGGPEWE